MGRVNIKDSIGQRGESIFYVLMTRLYGRTVPIFRPQFLGDKWPIVDFIVELTNYAGRMIPYCFIQIKTTRKGYTQQTRRLKVHLSLGEMQRLALYPAPTYLVGIDEIAESGYLIAVNGQHQKGLTSLSTQFPLDKETQDLLWQEVVDFWEKVDLSKKGSKFIDPAWR